ncbi:WAT1-related protein [Vitis vinifera]|uniref:WAT1-related protein n=1 Tax=Vitis vinifera TaxID=29760 RepID=A0A438G7F6_VITVI|nr:WAT1-related protein [Vitis vinifera]
MEMKNLFMASRPVLAMLLLQALGTAMQLLLKVALNKGAFVYAFVVYCHAIATVCVAPLAFFFERNKEKKLTFEVWFWLFMNAITGVTMAVGLFYYGVRDTTATFASNMINLVPVITFAFSTVFGIEKLLLKTKAGKMKIAGTIICLVGALITILYKGKSFHIGHVHMFENSIIKKRTHWARGSNNILMKFDGNSPVN